MLTVFTLDLTPESFADLKDTCIEFPALVVVRLLPVGGGISIELMDGTDLNDMELPISSVGESSEFGPRVVEGFKSGV